MTSPLEDVVAKGKQHYYAGKSFRRWSLLMLNKYGPEISPYLDDAWKLLDESPKLAQQVGNIVEGTKTMKSFEGKEETEQRCSEPSVLYRLVGPGRFAPVPRESTMGSLANAVPAWLAGLLTRKTIVALGAIAFVLAGLFPPWLRTLDVESVHLLRNAGYAFIASPPTPGNDGYKVLQPELPGRLSPLGGIRLDTSRLLVEWCCILVMAGAAWFVCGVSKPKDQNPRP